MSKLLPLLCLLTACSGLSNDEIHNLTRYQANAKLYLEGGGLDQSLDQIERGLAIDPQNYQLISLKGMVLLRMAKTAGGSAENFENRAATLFADLYATRSATRHERHVLLGYGMALQAQGFRNRGEAARLRDSAGRVGANTSEGTTAVAKATEHEAIGRSQLLRAREVFSALEQRGDLPRLAHYHGMQVAAALRDKAGTFDLGDRYLEENRKEQQWQRDEIARTTTLDYERERRKALQQLRGEELEVRTFLADMHYQQTEFQEALGHLDSILEIDPGRSADYYNRGRCLQALGRVEAAKSDFRKFLATSELPAGSPKMTEAVQALERH